MSRVEWTRIDNNDVEAVVAMCVNRWRPNSVRITPSRGDGGVDILDRDTPVGDVVLQVQNYSARLTRQQKAEVKKSLKRVLSDPRWSDLRIGEWHLVTPWDPEPDEEHWLVDLGRAHGLRAVWDGLGAVEQYVAVQVASRRLISRWLPSFAVGGRVEPVNGFCCVRQGPRGASCPR
jgi:hypothetical protein